MQSQYDVVIVGAGAAGLSAALSMVRQFNQHKTDDAASSKPRIIVFSKLQALRSHTGSAEGGIAASLGNMEHDDWHWHYYDTVKGGDWLVDQDAARILAQYAPQTVINLERSGVAFSRRADGRIAQRRFGGHTAHFGEHPIQRAAYAADRVGHQILHALWQQCQAAGVQFAEEWYVTDLVLDEARQQVRGIVAFDTEHGSVMAIHAPYVLMATGGAGRLFHTTSNSWDLTGDGMALAIEAGLQIEDIEFMQFHPTGLAHTGLLLSEAARAEGGVLRNSLGQAFMQQYAPEQRDLAARDVVSRAMLSEIDAGRGVADPSDPTGAKDCLWLDLRSIPRERLHTALPQVEETIRRYANLDPATDLVPVRPTAHYTMGGIPITTDGRVYRWADGHREAVGGLFAAGECSCVSVHGANRLGGNSLLDACLFGTRAGRTIADSFMVESGDSGSSLEGTGSPRDTDAESPNDSQTSAGQSAAEETLNQRPANEQQRAGTRDRVEEAAEHRRQEVDELLDTDHDAYAADGNHADNTAGSAGREDMRTNPYALLDVLGSTMERAVAVRCNESSIGSAIDTIRDELMPRAASLHAHSSSPVFNQEVSAIWEVRHLLDLAQAMLRTTRSRHESRGSLYRTDYLGRDDEHFLAHSMVDRSGLVTWQPVHILDMPPQSRGY